jgi:hypothetical protein
VIIEVASPFFGLLYLEGYNAGRPGWSVIGMVPQFIVTDLLALGIRIMPGLYPAHMLYNENGAGPLADVYLFPWSSRLQLQQQGDYLYYTKHRPRRDEDIRLEEDPNEAPQRVEWVQFGEQINQWRKARFP